MKISRVILLYKYKKSLISPGFIKNWSRGRVKTSSDTKFKVKGHI